MLVPRPDKIFVEPIYDPDKIGSLFVPEQAKERVDQGIVKYVGVDCKYLMPGDYVLFSGYTGFTVDLEGEGLMIVMREREVLAIVGDSTWTHTEVPGLYYKNRNGNFFNATVETASRLLAKAAHTSSLVRPPLNPKYRKVDRRFFDPEDQMAMEELWDDVPIYKESKTDASDS